MANLIYYKNSYPTPRNNRGGPFLASPTIIGASIREEG